MRYWQVRACMKAGGGEFVFGVQAEDEEAAWGKVAEMIGDPGWQGHTFAELQEIPPRRERGPAARRPVD